MFSLQSPFKPIHEQKKAASMLIGGLKNKKRDQVLLGVTGSGKTFTIAQIIQETKHPTLILSHNKTLAAQLYQEMKDFFPQNAVSYFVSYYDYYQPEAYIPQTDTYIEKEASINEFIDRLRLKTTSNILTREDVIVVASVSCIYNIGSPIEYQKFMFTIQVGKSFSQAEIMKKLISLQYDRAEFDFTRGTFRLRGGNLDIYPATADYAIKVAFDGDMVTDITMLNPTTGKKINQLESYTLNAAKHYVVEPGVFDNAEQTIREDLKAESQALAKRGKKLEAERLIKRVNFDLEMIKEVGYVNGIENYSRYFDNRSPGDPPHTLLDYFEYKYGQSWLLVADESHMTIPQLRGMYRGDQSRKRMLVDYGFRLRAAFDNRPLKINEFLSKVHYTIYASATPSAWEIERSGRQIAEQLIRPTGILDPIIEVRPAEKEIQNLIEEIRTVVKDGNRVLVTALTKRIAEDLTTYLTERGIRAQYLHSDIKTLERTDILQKLRRQEYDVLVGINLLREGLDLPEVALVAILDADKEGFLRNRTSLIQTMGRAARHIDGKVILYADRATASIKTSVEEVKRRRSYQIRYNKKYNIKPRSIKKDIREDVLGKERKASATLAHSVPYDLEKMRLDSLTPMDRKRMIGKIQSEMRRQARSLNFEEAIYLRDKALEIKQYNNKS
ncbi:MAG: excinuclease ABC subunit UvrB [Candidatus Paceibacterota bacterium]